MSDIAVSGEPSTPEPPWKYKIVPGVAGRSAATSTARHPPNVVNAERTPSAIRIVANATSISSNVGATLSAGLASIRPTVSRCALVTRALSTTIDGAVE